MSEFTQGVKEAAEFAMGKVDQAVDSMGNILTGESGRKVAGGAAVGAIAAVVLPVSLVGGAMLGAGYAAFRQYGKRKTEGDIKPL